MDRVHIAADMPREHAAALERLLSELLQRHSAEMTEHGRAGAVRMRQALAAALAAALAQRLGRGPSSSPDAA